MFTKIALIKIKNALFTFEPLNFCLGLRKKKTGSRCLVCQSPKIITEIKETSTQLALISGTFLDIYSIQLSSGSIVSKRFTPPPPSHEFLSSTDLLKKTAMQKHNFV